MAWMINNQKVWRINTTIFYFQWDIAVKIRLLHLNTLYFLRKNISFMNTKIYFIFLFLPSPCLHTSEKSKNFASLFLECHSSIQEYTEGNLTDILSLEGENNDPLTSLNRVSCPNGRWQNAAWPSCPLQALAKDIDAVYCHK